MFCLMGMTALPSLSKAETVSGTVTLEGRAQSAQSVTFAFVSTTQQYFFTRTTTLNADGSYALTDIPPDQYLVEAKAARWLADTGSVSTLSGNALFSPFLGAGDTNNDNSVDSTDFMTLIGAFGSSRDVPGSGYDPMADLNGDGSVDSSDFTLLIGQYNNTGGDIPALHTMPLAQIGQYRMISQKGGVGVGYDKNGMEIRTKYSEVLPNFYGCSMGSFTSASLTGAITTKFQWQPRQTPDPIFGGLDDPADTPPEKVVVYEYCEADGTGDGFPVIHCDNGIVGGEVAGGGRIGGVKGSYGDQYQVQSGGKYVTLTRSPSVTSSLGDLSTHVGAGIQYQAAVWPITLNFTGLTQDPAKPTELPNNVLIGQGVSASFSIGPYKDNANCAAHFTNHQWKIPGNAFASYVVAQDDSSAVLTPLTAAVTTAPTPHWYWAQEGGQNVSGTADVYAPQHYSSANPPPALPIGVTDNPPLPDTKIDSVTKSRSITVDKPDLKIYGPMVGGPTAITPDGVLISGQVDSSPCISATAIALTPSQYRSTPTGVNGTSLNNESGYIYNTQLINSVRTQRSSGNPFDGKTLSTEGQFWLDGQAHYALTYTADSKPNDPDNVRERKTLLFTDTPQSTLIDGAINLISVNDVFQNYLMYVPPGSDVAPVPLQRFDWTWQANFVSSVLSGWQSVAPTYTSAGAPYECHEHPQWSQKYVSDP